MLIMKQALLPPESLVSYWMSLQVIKAHCMSQCSLHANLEICCSLFSADCKSHHSYEFHSHKWEISQILSKLIWYRFEHVTAKHRLWAINISIPKLRFFHQKCSKIPKIVTISRDMSCFYVAEYHWHLEYMQLYSGLCYITNWIYIG